MKYALGAVVVAVLVVFISIAATLSKKTAVLFDCKATEVSGYVADFSHCADEAQLLLSIDNYVSSAGHISLKYVTHARTSNKHEYRVLFDQR
jgi:hypothetical protein